MALQSDVKWLQPLGHWSGGEGFPSFLSPVFFNTYMKALREIVQHLAVQCPECADDIQLGFSFPVSFLTTEEAVLTSCITYGQDEDGRAESRQDGGLSWSVERWNRDSACWVTFTWKTKVCSLNVLLDSILYLDAQVSVVVRSTCAQL